MSELRCKKCGNMIQGVYKKRFKRTDYLCVCGYWYAGDYDDE